MFELTSINWKTFNFSSISIILKNFLDLIITEFVLFENNLTELNFIWFLSRLNPIPLCWFQLWLHNFYYRQILTPKLINFLNKIIVSINQIRVCFF